MSVKLAFSKKLQAVTNRIHSTNNIDEIILDVSRDICQLFEADRMTVYITSEDGLLDRLEGEDGPQLLQGHQAADLASPRSPASAR